ncbi:transcription antitermination factor NusB [Candidatus Peregrinibacteria bacterium CG10_big_fil_rev_8_21_14_0_10_49_24]|nr:MAG: transcription antitermination factor NusB [Candidatus Peregrinibacteria bacterium CG11_big_fil_rev_8_21_14_0_20_49_14]PIR50839.1 MAG: transcription antitermination factor NusB [Candidatus Peregrinibacteria bacterium CG10_big_fil_rev_8_21_14_0_10_49_24]PJA67399.1 MAG: transcription antitermination factor NusB [Candidatus Peregrinibacteria bacterium CG_4_9_14_3_um_filter_49_12]
MARKRHLSRIAVMQVLFERESRDIDPETVLIRNTADLGDIDTEFALKLLLGVIEKERVLQDAVQADAPQWSLDRMDPISRCILLIGAYEIMFGNDAPPAVVMNEAIEITKEYGTAEGGKFVNGVLNAIAHHKK